MSCTDEKRWKNGKRLAEKDEYVGGNFFNCVTAPSELLDSTKLSALMYLCQEPWKLLFKGTAN